MGWVTHVHTVVHYAASSADDQRREWLAHWLEAIAASLAVAVATIAIVAPDHLRRREETKNASRIAAEMLIPIARLGWELARIDLPRARQVDWMIAAQKANIAILEKTPFRFLQPGGSEDDIYFAWIICGMTLDALRTIQGRSIDAEALDRIRACERRADDRLAAIGNAQGKRVDSRSVEVALAGGRTVGGRIHLLRSESNGSDTPLPSADFEEEALRRLRLQGVALNGSERLKVDALSPWPAPLAPAAPVEDFLLQTF